MMVGPEKTEALRALFVQETNWIDRNVIHQHHLAERLARRGHEVTIIDYDILWRTRDLTHRWMPRQVFPAVSRVLDDVSLPVIRPATLRAPLACHLSWTAGSIVELRRVIANRRPDVVIGLTLTNSLLMAMLLGREGIPYISVVLEPYHTMMAEQWVRPLARTVERMALQRADRVIVFTPQMRRYVHSMRAPEERVVVLKTGVSLDRFRPELDGSARREELGLESADWVLFFMGWLYEFSGLREIVQAVVDDPGLLDGARLVIVGDGDIYQGLVQLVDQHKLRGRVILTGLRPYADIPSLVAAADVCLLPSLENQTTRDIVPMKVYEYLAAGKPVVSCHLPGIAAEFGNQSGIEYADHPVDALRRAVGLSGRSERVRRLGEAGRRVAERNADWEKTTDRFERLLLSCRDRGGTREAVSQ
jgi:glycosyltransferase involved in cell wall biosynthesis